MRKVGIDTECCTLALKLAEKVEVEYMLEKADFQDASGPLDIQDFLQVFKKFAVAEDMFPVAKCVT